MSNIKKIFVVMLLAVSFQVWAYTPHDPIVISGDSDFTAQNGVTGGSGSSTDPYVISGWEITTGDTCITVSNTTSYFVVTDNTCYNPVIITATIRTGFSFTNVSNGTVSANEIHSLYGEIGDTAGENGGSVYGIVLEDVTNFDINNENNLYMFLGGVGYLGASGGAGGGGGAAYGIYATGTNSELDIVNNTFGTVQEGLLGGTGGAGGPGGATGGAGGYGGHSYSVYIIGELSDVEISYNTFAGSFGGNGGAGALGDAGGNGGKGGDGGLQYTVFVDGAISQLEVLQNQFNTLQSGTGGLGGAGTAGTDKGGDGAIGGHGGAIIPIIIDGSNEIATDVIVANNTIGPVIYAGYGAEGDFGATGAIGGNGGHGGNGGPARGVLVSGVSGGSINGNNISDLRAGGGGAAGIGAVGNSQGGNGGNGGASANVYAIMGVNLTDFSISTNTITDIDAGNGAVGAVGAYANFGDGGDGGNGAHGGIAIGIMAENAPSIEILNNEISIMDAGVGGIGAIGGNGNAAVFGQGGNGGHGGSSGDAIGIRVNYSDDTRVEENTLDGIAAGALAGIGNNAGLPNTFSTGGDGGNGGNGTGIYFSNSNNPSYLTNIFRDITAGEGNVGGIPFGRHGIDGVSNTIVLESDGSLRRCIGAGWWCPRTPH